jgi:hypothetical protein
VVRGRRVPADYGVEVYAPGLTLARLELVVKVAKEHSSDFGIGSTRG